ncbi:MAG: GCN5-related N-acetyltransferase [Actinomycetia bacterium]|nr:GCN5-related N-acetyltransferase [Actinomycetes bacterium]
MVIREIDPRSAPDEELLTIHRIEEACSHERPFRNFELSRSYYRVWSEGNRRWWLAGDVGVAVLMTVPPSFNYVQILVRPEACRGGIGTELLAHVVAAARSEGVASFFAHHHDAAGAAFARKAGAVEDQRDVHAEIRLRDVDLPEPVVPSGWRLLSWTGPAPDDLVASYARARAAIDDAPTPGDMAMTPIDVAWVRQMEATAAARGRESRVTVAIDADGVVGAFTDLRVSPPPSPVATTDDTATISEARNRGLAYAVKLELLRRLREERPDVEVVRTVNAEHNHAMRAVNTKLGFVPTAVLTTAVLTL